MNNLQLYGWSEALEKLKQQSSFNEFMHGRVTVTHKTNYEVIARDGTFVCELTGNMLYGKSTEEYPCTGDWVIFQAVDKDKGIIMDRLPRQKTLYRLKSGTVSARQPIAAHITKAFIVQSLDEHFNVRRIERFMLQMAEEDIQPALVLSKTDLGYNQPDIEKALVHLKNQMPLFYTSIQHPESIDSLRSFILPGETAVFTGMSGAGKSTLINSLCGKDILETDEISSATGKGKHTTTRREMVLLENSGVLIDTPGVKLFGVTNSDTQQLTDMLDITKFEKQCRYSDCQHVNEEGCAVIEAVVNGEIDEGVYQNYLKLKKEAWHYSASVHEKRQREKSFARMVKEVKSNPFKKR